MTIKSDSNNNRYWAAYYKVINSFACPTSYTDQDLPISDRVSFFTLICHEYPFSLYIYGKG